MKSGRPGHRFQDHYRREKRANGGQGSKGRMWKMALGIVLVAVGIVFCVIPGPGIPFLFIGGALLAAESLAVARMMDWLEVRVRALVRWARARWDALPMWGKVVVAVLAIVSGAAAAYLGYRLIAG